MSLAFPSSGVLLVVIPASRWPQGNSSVHVLYEMVLSSYWLDIGIPIAAVGSSAEAHDRGAIRWLIPTVLVTTALFCSLFGGYQERSRQSEGRGAV